MKTCSILFLLFFALMLPGTTNAQLGGALRRAINKQIDHKIDSAVEKKANDNARQNEQSQSQTNSSGASTKETGRGLFGGKIDIKYSDEYQFTGRIHMQMENYSEKDPMISDYFTYFNSNTLNASIEFQPVNPKEGDKAMPTIFIFDNDTRAFIMLLNNGESKTGIISSMPSDSAMQAQAKNQKGSNPEKANITKTGNSRMIAGYKCDEYKIVDPEKEGYSNVWMTKDVKLKADKKYWGKAGVPTFYNYPGFEGAMMLAMESFDKKNKPSMKMETKEINDNFSKSISTVGYTFMKMNFGQAGKK